MPSEKRGLTVTTTDASRTIIDGVPEVLAGDLPESADSPSQGDLGASLEPGAPTAGRKLKGGVTNADTP